jgi:transposase-like protein
LAAEYLKGGESLTKFARRVRASEASVTRWLKEAGHGDGGGGQGLLPVVVRPMAAVEGEHVEVALADGTALRMPASIAPERLEALLAAVRRTC